jgi:Cof subfamily protein (haloacid dehalogenase superfamily)
MKYRLAAIDLDETLLDSFHQISERNAAAVRMLAASGVTCVIASGRMYEATTRYARELGLQAPIICYNGAMVKHTASKEVWLHNRVPAGPSMRIIEFCHSRGHHLNFYLDDHLFVERRSEWADFYLRQTGSPMEAVGSLLPLRGSEPTKMILIDTPEVTDGLLVQFREEFGPSLYITKTNSQYLEFMNPAANKGAALALVAERLGISRAETIAFGDGANDLPMIQWAGLGVSMGSAKPEVLAAADKIAPPYDEDGLATVIEEILGIL